MQAKTILIKDTIYYIKSNNSLKFYFISYKNINNLRNFGNTIRIESWEFGLKKNYEWIVEFWKSLNQEINASFISEYFKVSSSLGKYKTNKSNHNLEYTTLIKNLISR